MKANVGGVDKALRILIGVLLIVLAFAGVIGAWGYIGIIVLATGIFNFCALYTLLGINTCKVKK